jgi:hypothetical protein
VPERSNGAVLKTADRRKAVREFKSHPRRLSLRRTPHSFFRTLSDHVCQGPFRRTSAGGAGWIHELGAGSRERGDFRESQRADPHECRAVRLQRGRAFSLRMLGGQLYGEHSTVRDRLSRGQRQRAPSSSCSRDTTTPTWSGSSPMATDTCSSRNSRKGFGLRVFPSLAAEVAAPSMGQSVFVSRRIAMSAATPSFSTTTWSFARLITDSTSGTA